MQWHEHSEIEGKHAFLSPSKKSWLNYDAEKLAASYENSWATEIGTALHAFAEIRIKRRKRLTKSCKDSVDQFLYESGIPEKLIDVDKYFDNLALFVNDAIGFRMDSEVGLKISNECFGHTDAISYDEKNKILRISDYKSGITEPSMDQLLIYAALFFIEYQRELRLELSQLKVELRLYYQEQVLYYEPDEEVMAHIVDTVVCQNKTVQAIKN